LWLAQVLQIAKNEERDLLLEHMIGLWDVAGTGIPYWHTTFNH
jgi:hypothetical protein